MTPLIFSGINKARCYAASVVRPFAAPANETSTDHELALLNTALLEANLTCRLGQSPTDALIKIKVRGQLRGQIPMGLNLHAVGTVRD